MAPARPAATGKSAPGQPSRGQTQRGRAKGQGQWALGHREPLNANEQVKKDDDGLHVRRRVETIYAHRGFSSIDPADLRGRLRWWGLYTQRRPGIDGGKTAVLEPWELDDEYFMLRVRIDGGQLTTEQLRVIGEVSTSYARDTADLTDRQNVQLHWIRIEDVPAIWQRLEGVGLTTAEACGDTPRDPGQPGRRHRRRRDRRRTPAIEEIHRRFIGNPAFSNLPRKFKTAVSGSPHQDVWHEVNDVSFVGVVHPQHGPGFDVWVGGAVHQPDGRPALGGWAPVEEVADVWAGIVGVFRDYGYRRLRSRARIKFLVADWGAERFRQVLEDEYLGRRIIDGPPPPHRRTNDATTSASTRSAMAGSTSEWHPASAGYREPCCSTSPTPPRRTDRAASGRPPSRSWWSSTCRRPGGALVTDLELLDLQARPSTFRRQTMACTGIEFCKLAIVETKAHGATLVAELEKRLRRSTRRSRSTSTVARTRAPASRSPTSASRAWSSTAARGFRCTSAAPSGRHRASDGSCVASR